MTLRDTISGSSRSRSGYRSREKRMNYFIRQLNRVRSLKGEVRFRILDSIYPRAFTIFGRRLDG